MRPINEERHCFTQEAHEPHVWQGFYCAGQGIDPETQKVREDPSPLVNTLNLTVQPCDLEGEHRPHVYKEKDFLFWCGLVRTDNLPDTTDMSPIIRGAHSAEPIGFNSTFEAGFVEPKKEQGKPAVLDGRTAYGDKVQNQIEQAAMINAYLSGREVRPVDVPAIFMLIKLHRLGKMPDYVDSYDDIEGYLSIARDVIGEDMIHAATAKEYMEIKNRGSQQDGRTLEDYQRLYNSLSHD